MPMTRNVGWSLVGAGTTMLVRTATRRILHTPSGAPRLPRVRRRNRTFSTMLLLAATAGALLAVGDVFQEQRKQVTQIT
jgi:hypothetical protein